MPLVRPASKVKRLAKHLGKRRKWLMKMRLAPGAAFFLALVALNTGTAAAQTYTVLHTFTTPPYYTNTDGANPRGGLILSGNTLDGTTYEGGSSGKGIVFAVNM